MATYKVIQDIEAEDKILGPLTLRQFIYALIMCFFLYLCFVVVTKHAAFLLILFLPPAIFTGFFAAPFGRDQPTEVWAVAKIGFMFKPRKRIWDQSGIKELVTVTVPKKIERVYTNGLSQTEVNSRLAALATTIDSRGWAIKNINVNMYANAGASQGSENSDRLVGMSSMPQAVVDYDIKASDDILDEQSNPIAQQFTQLISASEQAHRQQLIDKMNGVPLSFSDTPNSEKTSDEVASLWFTGQPNSTDNSFDPQVISTAANLASIAPISAQPTDEELALLKRIKDSNETEQAYTSHMKTIEPLAAPTSLSVAPIAPSEAEPPISPVPAVQSPPSQIIQKLARSNDLNIATLAREAKKANDNGFSSQDEVIISLR